MKEKKFKRLFFDLETSFNIVASWRVGYNLNLDADSILQERAIICVAYKWEGEKEVHYLTWNKGNDKKLIQQFSKIMNEADEVIAHNGDKFDIKWLRTRCIYHNIPLIPDFQSIDTLKLSKKGFYFNSNKLNYIGKFLGLGEKLETGGFSLWKDVILHNKKAALDKMVAYCKQDVLLLEKVYNKLLPFIEHKTHKGVYAGKNVCSCPECTSNRTVSNGTRISAKGLISRRLHCMDCGKYFSISESAYQKVVNSKI